MRIRTAISRGLLTCWPRLAICMASRQIVLLSASLDMLMTKVFVATGLVTSRTPCSTKKALTC